MNTKCFVQPLMNSLLVLVCACTAATSFGQTTDGSNATPVITIAAPDPVAVESGDPGRFVLHRMGPTNASLAAFLVIGGTASNGVDYAEIPSFITIPAGVRTVPVPVRPVADNLVEGPETIAVRLEYPPVMGPMPVNYTIGSPSNALVIIYDHPPLPVVTLRAIDPNASEPGLLTVIDPGVFRVFRDGSTNDELNVLYSIRGTASNGVDYASIPNHVVIPAGARTADIVVNPLHDLLPEGTESVVLRLEDPIFIAIYPPPPGAYLVGTPREAAVSIADNDQPTNSPPRVKLVKPLDGQTFLSPTNVLLVAGTVDPDGYVPRVEFFADNVKVGEQEKHFLTPPAPGTHIRYEFVWTNPPVGRHVLTARATDNGGAHALSDPVPIWVVNTNLPPPPPVVTIIARDPIASEGTNCLRWLGWSNADGTNYWGRNTATFVVRRHGPTNEALTVCYRVGGTASNGVDYAGLSGVVTIPAGHRKAPIVVSPVDDELPEPVETVVLRLCVPPATTDTVPPYVIGCPGRAAAIIVDNDRPRPETGVLDDRCFHLRVPGTNGMWFRIERSSDMVSWMPLCTNVVTDGAIHFIDPDADEMPGSFYRAVPEPNPPAE